MMARPAQDITESELAVLRILWDRGASTIRQLTEVLYPGGGAAQYATVQKLLDRMEAKNYVRRDRKLYVHVFEAMLDRDELIGRRLRSLAEALCDGSMTPLLTHLARAKDLTDEDRLALRAIIDETEDDQPDARPIRRGRGPRGGVRPRRGSTIMESLVHGMLSNAAAVTVLAVVIALAGRLCRRPALIHSVCLLAMLKLVTPPVVSLPVPGVASWSADSPAPALPDPDDPPLVPVGSCAEPAEATPLLVEIDGDWLPEEPVLEDLPEAEAAPASWSWEAVALGLVLSGALACWAVAAVRIVRFHRLIRDVESM